MAPKPGHKDSSAGQIEDIHHVDKVTCESQYILSAECRFFMQIKSCTLSLVLTPIPGEVGLFCFVSFLRRYGQQSNMISLSALKIINLFRSSMFVCKGFNAKKKLVEFFPRRQLKLTAMPAKEMRILNRNHFALLDVTEIWRERKSLKIFAIIQDASEKKTVANSGMRSSAAALKFLACLELQLKDETILLNINHHWSSASSSYLLYNSSSQVKGGQKFSLLRAS